MPFSGPLDANWRKEHRPYYSPRKHFRFLMDAIIFIFIFTLVVVYSFICPIISEASVNPCQAQRSFGCCCCCCGCCCCCFFVVSNSLRNRQWGEISIIPIDFREVEPLDAEDAGDAREILWGFLGGWRLWWWIFGTLCRNFVKRGGISEGGRLQSGVR